MLSISISDQYQSFRHALAVFPVIELRFLYCFFALWIRLLLVMIS